MDGKPIKGNERLRHGRFSEQGRVYLITTVTRHRRPLFFDLACARLVILALRHEQLSGRATTLAFVLMPDHLHWLMQLSGDANLSRVVQQVKGRSGSALVRGALASGAVWQPGYFDRALRREDDLRSAARYIVANPLRAGLVEQIGAYPHWDAIWL